MCHNCHKMCCLIFVENRKNRSKSGKKVKVENKKQKKNPNKSQKVKVDKASLEITRGYK